jgi:hypothetical protein
MAALETSKLLIIPLINNQNQPLYRIFASPSTLRNGFSYILIEDRNLITSLEQPLFHPLFFLKTKTTLFICFFAHPSVVPQRDFH